MPRTRLQSVDVAVSPVLPISPEEATNTRTVIGVMSGQLPGWEVYRKQPNGLRLFLGVISDRDQTAAVQFARKRWPAHVEGMVLKRRQPQKTLG